MIEILKFFLIPIGLIYNAITQLRLKFSKPFKASVPVICVGNINVGGVGKTPFTEYLANYLKEKKLKPAILSRGYKGKLKYVKVNNKIHNYKDVGDEPLMLSYTAPTYVGEDRAKIAQMAIKDGANILIMDDGFQSPTIYKDFSFVVIDGKTGLGNGQVIPSGPLREYLSFGKKRANAFVIVGPDKTGIKKKLTDFPVIEVKVQTKFKPSKYKAYYAFAGIGKPEKFYNTLRETGAKISVAKSFMDHHAYTNKELKEIEDISTFKNIIPITTSKDWVKFPNRYKKVIDFLPITYKIENEKLLAQVIHDLLT